MLNEKLLICWSSIIQILIDILLTSDPYSNSLVQELCDAIMYQITRLGIIPWLIKVKEVWKWITIY